MTKENEEKRARRIQAKTPREVAHEIASYRCIDDAHSATCDAITSAIEARDRETADEVTRLRAELEREQGRSELFRGEARSEVARLQARNGELLESTAAWELLHSEMRARRARWKTVARRFACRAFNWRENFRSVGADNVANIAQRDDLRARLATAEKEREAAQWVAASEISRLRGLLEEGADAVDDLLGRASLGLTLPARIHAWATRARAALGPTQTPGQEGTT